MDFLVERHPFDSKQGGFSMTSLGVKQSHMYQGWCLIRLKVIPVIWDTSDMIFPTWVFSNNTYQLVKWRSLSSNGDPSDTLKRTFDLAPEQLVAPNKCGRAPVSSKPLVPRVRGPPLWRLTMMRQSRGGTAGDAAADCLVALVGESWWCWLLRDPKEKHPKI